MPIAEFQLSDGRIAEFEVPEGTTPEQAAEMVQVTLRGMALQNLPQAPAVPQGPQLKPTTAVDLAAEGTGLGQLGGGIAGGLAGEAALTAPIRAGARALQAVPFAPAKAVGAGLQVAAPIIASGVGAFAGGATGEAVETLARTDMGQVPLALERALAAGQEEAALDVIANTVLRSGVGAAKLIKNRLFAGDPKIKGLMENLAKQNAGLTLDQAVTNTGIKTFGEVLRGGIFSSTAFEVATRKQEKTLLKFTDDFLEKTSNAFVDELSPEMSGRIVKEMFEGGSEMHSEISGVMFDRLDKLPILTARGPAVGVQEEVIQKKMAGVIPKDILRKSEAQVFKSPVNLSAVRANAQFSAQHIRNIGSPDMTDQGLTIMDAVANGSTNLTFRDTHILISDLKRLQRSPRAKELPKGVAIGKMIDDTIEAFEKAGNRLPGDANKIYKQARNFWRFGQERIRNDFLTKLAAKEPSELGKQLSKMGPEKLIKVRQMLRVSAGLKGSKDLPPFEEVWGKVRSGALEELLPRNIEQIATSKIAKRKTNKDLGRTLRVLLRPKERETFEAGVGLLEDIILNTQRKGNLIGREVGALAITGAAAIGLSQGTDLPPGVAAVLLAPRVLAQAMTHQPLVRALVTFDKAPLGSLKYTNALSKLIFESNSFLQGIAGENLVPTELQPPVPQ